MSFRSVIPAALSFAAAAHGYALPQDPPSGTVGAGAAGNTYANCSNPSWTCQSFGVDFQGGGLYFQNSLSTDPFTFASQFEGCQKTTAYNVLVDPNGNEFNCTNTNLTPDDTTVTSTCSLDKDQLFTGDWSVLIYSNNGACAPLAASRDFFLTVAPQVTSTITPGVVFTSTSTPVLTLTTTSTSTLEFYAPTPTVTSQKSVKAATRTVTPVKWTTIETVTLSTKTVTSYALLVSNKLATRTAKCTISSAASTPDASVTSTPSAVQGTVVITSSAIPTSSSVPGKRSVVEELIGGPIEAFIERRAANLDRALVKRAPDVSAVTVLVTDPASYSTSIVTQTAPTVTFESTVVPTVTTTSTPLAVTLYQNTQAVVTLSQKTVTKTRTLTGTVLTTTNTKYATATVTTTVTPSAAAAKCSKSGGFMQ